MPVFVVTYVFHLLNKIDDIDVCLRQFRPNIVCFTEIWLNSNIPDSIISFPGYSVVRRDRCSGEGGGVAIYVTDNIQYTRLKQIDSKEFEVLWISLRPRQLPRPINISCWLQSFIALRLCARIVRKVAVCQVHDFIG
jgi:hypothetical protein